MADPKDDEPDWKPPERQLRPDGRMTGDLPKGPELQLEGISPTPNKAGLPSLDALTTSDLVLDTLKPAARPAYVEPDAYRPIAVPDRSSPLKWVLLLVVLGVAALATFMLVPGLQRKLPLPAGTKGTLVIYSEPSGATVKIAGKSVGETPWASDNLWAGEVKYEILAGGYKPQWGTFRGGEDVKLNVTLTKR